ncbi:hypothetical protein ABT023_10685 [Micromonospora sp. NPDC002296]|uniref:hypothetical protein n=1 Tax=Micromonospora sp. NPDC002296 TaxID=3154271 RepID=UPI003331FFF1
MFDVRIQLGAVLKIDAADRVLPSAGPVTMWVTGVRLVLNRPPHNEWLWVEGFRLGPSGRQGPQSQILVRGSSFLPDRAAR